MFGTRQRLDAHERWCDDRHRAIDKRFDKLEEKVGGLETKVDNLATMLAALQSSISSNRWATGLIVALLAVLVAERLAS